MNNRIVAAVAAGALAVGILIGATGVIVTRDVEPVRRGPMMGDPMMGGPMMGGPMMGGLVDDMWELHRQHHGVER